MPDPTERRMVKCSACAGYGHARIPILLSGGLFGKGEECATCKGMGKVLEPAEAYALRLQQMYRRQQRWLRVWIGLVRKFKRMCLELCKMSFVLSNSCDWCEHSSSDCANRSKIKKCITARLEAAEKATTKGERDESQV